MSKWEQNAVFEYSEYICLVKRINGIVAQKTLVTELVRCKECKHRPIKEDADGENYGFNVIAPNMDERCPCLVEDGWYSWIPKDNFYCGYGEREGE